MSISAAIRRMLEAGLTIDQALTAAECMEAEMQPARSARQERNARHYAKLKASKASEKRLNQTDSDDQDASPTLPPEARSPTPPKTQTPNLPPSPPKGGSSPTPKQPSTRAKNPMGWPADGWERFWSIYPNKVGKADARKAFDRAQARASIPFEALIAGLEAYVSKTDDRPWCNPATWLNQDRWEDRPATGPPRRQTPPRRGDPMMELAFELHGAGHDRDRPDHQTEPEILPPERDASGDRGFARSDDIAARTPARQSVHDRGGSGAW